MCLSRGRFANVATLSTPQRITITFASCRQCFRPSAPSDRSRGSVQRRAQARGSRRVRPDDGRAARGHLALAREARRRAPRSSWRRSSSTPRSSARPRTSRATRATSTATSRKLARRGRRRRVRARRPSDVPGGRRDARPRRRARRAALRARRARATSRASRRSSRSSSRSSAPCVARLRTKDYQQLLRHPAHGAPICSCRSRSSAIPIVREPDGARDELAQRVPLGRRTRAGARARRAGSTPRRARFAAGERDARALERARSRARRCGRHVDRLRRGVATRTRWRRSTDDAGAAPCSRSRAASARRGSSTTSSSARIPPPLAAGAAG